MKPNNDLIEALGDRYLTRRTPSAFFKLVIRERFDFLLKLITDFRVDGVVWYSLMYRDSYDREAVLFNRELEKKGIPFLRLSSDYSPAEKEFMRMRIEALMESIKLRR